MLENRLKYHGSGKRRTSSCQAMEYLRPISPTSCVGKLTEHDFLARLTNYLEGRDLFPSTMLGFRRNLSTQGVMLQFKPQIMDTQADPLEPSLAST